MSYIPQEVRDAVVSRADNRCEYCQTAQVISGSQMNIEHIIPQVQGGNSKLENLCLSCSWCNSYKWAHTRGWDDQAEQTVPLFNPRTQEWHKHFHWSENGLQIIGKTTVGRATVNRLKMNNEYIVPARQNWVEAGWHPPDT